MAEHVESKPQMKKDGDGKDDEGAAAGTVGTDDAELKEAAGF